MRAGGAHNHRGGLYDAILIKENHIAAAGGIAAAIEPRGPRPGAGRDVEVEVRDPEEIDRGARRRRRAPAARQHGPSTQLRAAVAQVGGRAQLEASGGVTLETLRAVGRDRRRLRVDGCADAFGAGARSVAQLEPAIEPLPMARPAAPGALRRGDRRAARRRSVRSRASATRSSSPTTTSCPRSRTWPTSSATRWPLAAGGRSRTAATIVFCGVHFMAETASILSPQKTVLIPDLDAGCSLAESITAAQLADWKAEHPGAVVVMYVNTSAEVKALTDYCCTSANAVAVVRHIHATHGEDTEILFGPDMLLGAYVERVLGRRDARLGRRVPRPRRDPPADIDAARAAHPEAEFLIHPECGCSTSVMEYVAAGDIDADGRPHALHRRHARATPARPSRRGSTRDRRDRGRDALPAAEAAPQVELHPRQRGGLLPLHEDDHAAQAARLACAHMRLRGEGAGRTSPSGARCRSSAWSRSAERPPPARRRLSAACSEFVGRVGAHAGDRRAPRRFRGRLRRPRRR